MDLFTKHVEPYRQVYERLGKVSRRSRSECMKDAPSGFLDNIRTVARNIDCGSFKLNDEQFNNSQSGDRRFEEGQSSSRKRKRRRTHTSTPPFTPYFSPRKTRGQRQREQKKVKKEPKTPKQSCGPRGKGSMVQSWFN